MSEIVQCSLCGAPDKVLVIEKFDRTADYEEITRLKARNEKLTKVVSEMLSYAGDMCGCCDGDFEDREDCGYCTRVMAIEKELEAARSGE